MGLTHAVDAKNNTYAAAFEKIEISTLNEILKNPKHPMHETAKTTEGFAELFLNSLIHGNGDTNRDNFVFTDKLLQLDYGLLGRLHSPTPEIFIKNFAKVVSSHILKDEDGKAVLDAKDQKTLPISLSLQNFLDSCEDELDRYATPLKDVNDPTKLISFAQAQGAIVTQSAEEMVKNGVSIPKRTFLENLTSIPLTAILDDNPTLLTEADNKIASALRTAGGRGDLTPDFIAKQKAELTPASNLTLREIINDLETFSTGFDQAQQDNTIAAFIGQQSAKNLEQSVAHTAVLRSYVEAIKESSKDQTPEWNSGGWAAQLSPEALATALAAA